MFHCPKLHLLLKYFFSQFEINCILITTFFKSKPLDFEARSKLSKNKIGKKLFHIMSLKQTNLCLAADFTNFDQLLKVKILLHLCFKF